MELSQMSSWLGEDAVAVSLTFDLDGDAGFERRGFSDRLSSRSEAEFGVGRGLDRILSVLQRYSVPATFFVPGEVVDRHTKAVTSILEAGHEVGHHGYHHIADTNEGHERARGELEQGIAAMDKRLGVRPLGYRAPSWEMSPSTLRMLGEYGFKYDSSLMGDDRPYLLDCGDQTQVLELPVHWSLDDHPFFSFGRSGGGRIAGLSEVFATWTTEFDEARAERRHLTYTMHPEHMGRAHRSKLLCDLVEHIQSFGGVRFVRHADVADGLIST